MKTMVVGENDANQRLDKFLQKSIPLLPRSLMYRYIRQKRIKRNGKRCTASDKLCTGDVLSLYINDEFFAPRETPFLSAPYNLDIVYEDENILLVDKKPGMLVHADHSSTTDTLINRILHYLYRNGSYQPADEHSFTPALCNRIDRNTGGIVIAAKNFESLQILNQKIQNHELEKLYLCIVQGTPVPKSALLTGYHIKDTATNTVQITNHPVSGAKKAQTQFKVLASNTQNSLLEVKLLTGRSHQIRAHLSSIGHPLVGDIKYGAAPAGKLSDRSHQALYSYKLIFRFKTDAGRLAYLNNQSFTVQDIPFLKLYNYSLF